MAQAACLALIVLAFAFQNSPPHPVKQTDHRHTNATHTKEQASVPPSPSSASKTNVRQKEPDTVARTAKNEANPWRTAFRPDTWSNWALVLVGIVASMIGVCTLFGIRRQTAAIKQTAESTKRSVDAIMDADRAFILILWENWVHVNPEAPNGVLSHCFNWHFHNTGKSPAFIQKISSRFIVIKSLDDLPPEPLYVTPREVTYKVEPLLPGKKFGPVYAPIESTLSYEQLETEHRGKRCHLYVYGFVQYKDIYGSPHETRFGLIYDSAPQVSFQDDRFRLAGPPGYNRYT